MSSTAFSAQGLTKTCMTGEVELAALQGADRIFHFAGGRISGIDKNATRRAAAEPVR